MLIMKKRILYFFIATITILNLVSILAHAESDIIVELNGKKIQFDQPPIIQNDRTLVPMRAIFEAMGCDVEWDGENQWITATKDNITIEMMIDYNSFWVTDYGEGGTYARTLNLDVSPQIINGRTLVPLRAISESIGAGVAWNSFTRTVTITYTETNFNNASDFTTENTSSQIIYETPEPTFEYLKDLGVVKQYNDSNGDLFYVYRNGVQFKKYFVSKYTPTLEIGDECKMYVEYDLNGKYDRITGEMSGYSRMAFRFYCDDNLVLTTPGLGSESKLDLDVSGCNTLRIELFATVAKNSVSYNPFSTATIAEAKLWY